MLTVKAVVIVTFLAVAGAITVAATTSVVVNQHTEDYKRDRAAEEWRNNLGKPFKMSPGGF